MPHSSCRYTVGGGYSHRPRGKDAASSEKTEELISILYLRRTWLSVSRPKLSRSFFDLQSSRAIPDHHVRCQLGGRRATRQQTGTSRYVIYLMHGPHPDVNTSACTVGTSPRPGRGPAAPWWVRYSSERLSCSSSSSRRGVQCSSAV